MESLTKIFDADTIAAIKRIIYPIVDEDTHLKRINMCLQCPEYSNNIGQFCKKCRCAIAIKTKLRDSHCPLEKW